MNDRSPCLDCDRKDKDKNKCSADCARRIAYAAKMEEGIDWMPPPVDTIPKQGEAVMPPRGSKKNKGLTVEDAKAAGCNLPDDILREAGLIEEEVEGDGDKRHLKLTATNDRAAMVLTEVNRLAEENYRTLAGQALYMLYKALVLVYQIDVNEKIKGKGERECNLQAVSRPTQVKTRKPRKDRKKSP